jgi:uncharacterized protein with PIN domain
MGKLASYLRMLGFDTFYKNDLSDDEIISRSKEEMRIILTRDLGILKNGQVHRGYFIRQQKPVYQAHEIIWKFNLNKQILPFTRCMKCNGLFTRVKKDCIKTLVPPKAYQFFQDFYQCEVCRRIYWKGSHYEKMLKTIDMICRP